MCEYLHLNFLHVGMFFMFFMCMCRTEQVSARIVQEVTAEAVAVLKGEQELHPETAVRLPSGRPAGEPPEIMEVGHTQASS